MLARMPVARRDRRNSFPGGSNGIDEREREGGRKVFERKRICIVEKRNRSIMNDRDWFLQFRARRVSRTGESIECSMFAFGETRCTVIWTSNGRSYASLLESGVGGDSDPAFGPSLHVTDEKGD